MNIREKIGNRITSSRKKLGITIKELAERTKEFSPARISNWEQGTRMPGPMEARILAKELNISAAYLLCLTDSPLGEKMLDLHAQTYRQVPLLNFNDALNAKKILSNAKQPEEFEDNEECVIIDQRNGSYKGGAIFAVKVEDNSMHPEFNLNDIVIVDSEHDVKPGDFVLVYLTSKKQTVLRKYSEEESCLFQLLAINPLWAKINIKEQSEAIVLGVVIEHRRYW